MSPHVAKWWIIPDYQSKRQPIPGVAFLKLYFKILSWMFCRENIPLL